jgi:hypothetical protein
VAAIPKFHGPVLTSGWEEFKQAIAIAGHNLAKVVTAWGAPWNPDFIWSLAEQTTYTLVRTRTGDTGPLDAAAAIDELHPFYPLIRDNKGADKMIIEIGNEPNRGGAGFGYIEDWANTFHDTLNRIRDTFPGALTCSPGLSPSHDSTSSYHDWFWNQNFKNAINRCTFVGFHFYGDTTFDLTAGQDNVCQVMGALDGHFPGKLAIATEYGLNAPRDQKSNFDKGADYARFIHHNGNSYIQNRVWGATYFHIDTIGNDSYNVWPDGPAGYAQNKLRPDSSARPDAGRSTRRHSGRRR